MNVPSSDDLIKMNATEADITVAKYKEAPGIGKAILNGVLQKPCDEYAETDLYKKNSTHSDPANRVCCAVVSDSFCPFYQTMWFYCACAGVALLLIIIAIVISCCCCRKGRGGGGRDVEAVESSKSTETSTTTKTDDE